MTARVFIDTNVLVDADDLDAGPKNTLARSLVADALLQGTGVLARSRA